MSFTESSSYIHESLFTLRLISLKGSTSELYTRTPQGSPITLNVKSMLPQFKITSEVLNELWSLCSQENHRDLRVCTAYKSSPSHLLNLKVTEVHNMIKTHLLPPADYLLYLSFKPSSAHSDFLKSEETIFEKMMNSIERQISKELNLEPLDICKTLLTFSTEKSANKLQLKCEILYPSVNYQLTPISSLRLVSTPLSIKLTQQKKDKFQAGYLTMDQSGRVLPLLPTDQLVYKYPIVGIWVTGLPESQQSNLCSLTHPLVWASCIQFIENTKIKEKISCSLEENTFLLLHFSSKPKFYDVCTIGTPCWKISNYSTELRKEDCGFLPCYVAFLRENESISSLDVSSDITQTANSSFTPSGMLKLNFPVRINAPSNSISESSQCSSVSLKQSFSPSSDSLYKYQYFEGANNILDSPSAEKLINQQSQMLKHLQAQILELQAHIFHNNPEESYEESIPSTLTPMRSKLYNNGKCSDRVLFSETLKAQKSTAEDLSSECDREDLANKSLSKKSTNGDGFLNSLTQLPYENAKIHYNPLRYSGTSPEPSPYPYQSKPRSNNDNTIYVPKIQYDLNSDSSDEDEEVEAVERKYLYHN